MGSACHRGFPRYRAQRMTMRRLVRPSLDLVGETDEVVPARGALRAAQRRSTRFPSGRRIVEMRFFKEAITDGGGQEAGHLPDARLALLQQKALNQLREIMVRSE